MTRENKLALVVGFGLILFVGILISDHFSTVRSQRAANLARHDEAIDPLVSRPADDGLIDLRPATTQPPPVAANPTALGNAPPATGELNPAQPAPAAVALNPGSTTPSSTETHVASGTLPEKTPEGFVPVPL